MNEEKARRKDVLFRTADLYKQMPNCIENRPSTLLCVANYATNTGYAWDFIERLYAGIADRLLVRGIRTLVAYPAICGSPETLAGSTAQAVHLDATLNSRESIQRTVEFIKRENVQVVYFTDQVAYSSTYLRLRWAGVRHIVVHDHTSGARTKPWIVKRYIKWLLARLPWWLADTVITVSDYVAHRQIEVGLIPSNRVTRVWNGLPIPQLDPAAKDRVRKLLGFEKGRPLVACACRATPEKGVSVLFQAFNRISTKTLGPRPALVYVGDGPQLSALQALRNTLRCSKDIYLVGYRKDALTILEGADLCVIPSIWQDAFPLSVLETMALGKPVIGTRVGGIPEMVEHGRTGLLVPPSDDIALSEAIRELLVDPFRAAQLGAAARQRVRDFFTREQQLADLTTILVKGFGLKCLAQER